MVELALERLPPEQSRQREDMTALRTRLEGRGTDSSDAILRRLDAAYKEIRYAKEPSAHDYIIVNDNLERAYEKFRNLALGEHVVSDSLSRLDC